MQSFVLRTFDPWHMAPLWLGGGFVHVLVLIFPADRVDPGQWQSVQGDHGDQPPFTGKKIGYTLSKF